MLLQTNSATKSCRSIGNIRWRRCWKRAGVIRCVRGNISTFEYVLLGGFNDSPDDARRVVRLLANLRAKVNLIPWNPGDLPYAKPDPARIEAFRKDSCRQGCASVCALLARAGRDGCVRAAGANGNGSGRSEAGADFAAVTEGGGKQIPTTRERRRGYRGRARAAPSECRWRPSCGLWCVLYGS